MGNRFGKARVPGCECTTSFTCRACLAAAPLYHWTPSVATACYQAPSACECHGISIHDATCPAYVEPPAPACVADRYQVRAVHYDGNERSLGTFATIAEANAEIEKHAGKWPYMDVVDNDDPERGDVSGEDA